MGAGLHLLIGGPRPLYILGFGLLCLGLQIFIPYRRYVPYLKWLCLGLLAYVGILFVVQIPWPRVVHATLLPQIPFTQAALTAIVAIFGTTISPYLFFWQASEEVEDQQLAPGEVPLLRAPAQGPAQLGTMQTGTWVGMAVSNLVAYCIILTAAVVLHAHGITDIQTSSQAAEALRPVAGRFAFLLFSVGIIGTGLLAVPVLAGSSAYALGEARRWPVGLEKKPVAARGFYGVIALSTLVGVGLNAVHLDPVKALFWSAVTNGVVAAPLMVLIMLLASRKTVFAPIGPRERNDLLELIDDRVGTRACIVTSQLPVSDWHDYIGDPTLADAILHRLVHRAHRILLQSKESLRDRYAKKERTKSKDGAQPEG